MLMIPGPEGNLEASYHLAPNPVKAPIALVISPHPEHEGTMNHPVVYSLFRSFASIGMNVLRFNYRGSGNSQGTFVNNDGEVADAAAALDWMYSKNPNPPQCWIAGFSFGAYIALQLLMRRPECTSFIAVNPLVNLYDFSFLTPCPTPGLIVHSDNSLVPRESILRFVQQLSLQKKSHPIALKFMDNTNHDYQGKISELENYLYYHLRKKMIYFMDKGKKQA